MSHRKARIICAAMTPAVAALTSLAPAPTANATCASFFGLGNSANCTSTPTSIAIAIGNSASAYAFGNFGSALALGTNSYAAINSGGWFNSATAVGYNSGAVAGHILSLSLAVGPVSGAIAGPGPGTRVGNIAITLAPNEVGAYSVSDGIASVGVNLFSRNTIARADYGPLAIAGSIGQNNAVVTKSGPGINVNGVSLGGKKTVAVHAKAAAPKASGTGRSARN